MSHRCRRLVAFAGLSFAAVAGAQSGPGTAVDAVAAPPLALSARGMSLDAPATRIYRSVGADGSVVYGDQPIAGARAVQIRSFVSASDATAIATARRQQQYWREQADAFERRRADRQAAEARARADAERERDETERLVVVVPRNLRAPAFAAGPGVPIPGVPSSYGSQPGAAASAPAAFIGSGFATAR